MIVLETHAVFDKSKAFWTKLGFEVVGLVEAQGYSGGIWVLSSDDSMRIIVMDTHQQILSLRMQHGSSLWCCSAVYASPIPSMRENLWEHLVELRSVVHCPWLVLGDFNEVVAPSEISGGIFN